MHVHRCDDVQSKAAVLLGGTGDPQVAALLSFTSNDVKLRQPLQRNCCRLFFKLGSLQVYPARHAYLASESPSKPLHPHDGEQRIYYTPLLRFCQLLFFAKIAII